MKECAGGAQADDLREFKVEDLVCGGCSGATEKCKKHGTDYIEWKYVCTNVYGEGCVLSDDNAARRCRFCCKLATFFCGGKW